MFSIEYEGRVAAYKRQKQAQALEDLKHKAPLSMCSCGHTGDGNGQHLHTLAEGHGPCNVKGCPCRKFTWVGWLPETEAVLAKVGKEAEEEFRKQYPPQD